MAITARDIIGALTEQDAGCPAHLFVPSLVVGAEQIDADEEAETITYRLASGELWIDGAGANKGNSTKSEIH